MHSSFTNVAIYDIGTRQWYQQTSSGDIPPWRYVGCSVVVSAPDRSSHSIYVFGGWGNTAGASDGNVYVLSLPSFRWIRVNQDSDLRARHQCTLIGKNTMLVVGGIRPRGQELQPSDIAGCDTASMFSQGLGMFSLNNHAWSSNYDPLEGSVAYQVHPSILKAIGGTSEGGATDQTPFGGFSQPALATLLGVHEPVNGTLPISPISSSSSNERKGLSRAVIAGTTVAASICVIVVFLLILYLTWRHRHKQVPSRPPMILPTMESRKASEWKSDSDVSPSSQLWLVELGDSKGMAHELGSLGKPLPPRPDEPLDFEAQEMEGELGWHPAVRNEMEQRQNERPNPSRQDFHKLSSSPKSHEGNKQNQE